MHRGRTWTQRQLIGLGTPEDYNKRVRVILDAGATAISLIPCNSVFRGVDCDEVDPVLLGTCGTVINTTEHMDRALDGVPLGDISTAMNDPSPFTLLAFMLAVAKRRGIPWSAITGTSNQSDYISHFVANHMFFRLSLPGARRVLLDHIAFCRRHRAALEPGVGGRPAHAAGRRDAGRGHGLHALDRAPVRAGLHRARHGHRSTCCRASLSSSTSRISFFEEVAKFRAGRRIWARLTRERLGAKEPALLALQVPRPDLGRRSHASSSRSTTSPASPCRRWPASSSGLQSLHTDAYDEAITTPTEETARIAVATQNILREEAHLSDVIDPLGGSYYVETLTDQMEEKIAGGDRQDRRGRRHVQGGRSRPRPAHDRARRRSPSSNGSKAASRRWSASIAIRTTIGAATAPPTERPDPRAHGRRTSRASRPSRSERSPGDVDRALDALARAANSARENVLRADRRGGRSRRHARRDRPAAARRARLWPSPCRRLIRRARRIPPEQRYRRAACRRRPGGAGALHHA